MEEEEIPNILRSQYIIDEFDRQKLANIGDILCDTDKVNIMLRSRSFDASGATDSVEPFYGTKYKIEDFSDGLRSKLKNPSSTSQLDLPPKNSLIPTNFDLLDQKPDFSDEP